MKRLPFLLLPLMFMGALCVNNSATNQSSTNTPPDDADQPRLAFFYQVVGLFENGVGKNSVQVGSTTDGQEIQSHEVTALDWEQGQSITDSYGDPVFSYLPNGTWTFTSWTSKEDPRGSEAMLYWEGSCPVVNDADVIVFHPSTDEGCESTQTLQVGKTSQVFSVNGGTYVFHSTLSGLHLAKLSDQNQSALNLENLCLLPESVTQFEDLDWGESTLLFSNDEIFFSDSAIAQRADGTWVLFIKGIEKESSCDTLRGLCELCARGIYRTTSQDLITWTPLERVVDQASVPEATQAADGTVWLYYQDFSNTCAAQNLQLASIAPISGVYETANSYELSSSTQVKFVDEDFQTNQKLHYATNGNPVMLPDASAQAAFEACLK